ncbi:DUF7373 family lipoprotein [Nocardia sp. NPDC003482]
MRFLRRASFAALASLVAITAAGCGSTSGTPRAAEIDVRKLDVGKYPTDPNDFRYKYFPGLDSGKELAAMRLADKVVNGVDIDPKLTNGNADGIVQSSDWYSSTIRDSVDPILARHDMLYGFASSTADHQDSNHARDGDISVDVLVLQFPDDTHATDAAKELEAADFDVARDLNQPVALPKYPTATSHWRPGIRTMGSWIARGSYVVQIFVRTPRTEISDLVALAQRTYDVQLPLLDSLPPLSKRDVLRMPYDPEGMLRRAFTSTDVYSPSIPLTMVISGRAFLHFGNSDINGTKSDFDKFGIDLIGVMRRDSIVTRTRDAAAAQGYADKLRSAVTLRVDAPPGVPDAFCSEDPQSNQSSASAEDRFRCIVHYGRYVAKVQSAQLLDLHQRAAAQYAMLANSW